MEHTVVFNKNTFERFAMQVETSSLEVPPEAYGLGIDAVSKMLNISQGDGRALAKYMGEIGWAVTTFKTQNPYLVLTPKGHEEIAKLRRPRVERWFDARPKTTAALISVSVVLLAELLKNLLWPK